DKRLQPYEHRLAMTRLAMAPFVDAVEVSDLERRLGGESRTVRTAKALREERPGDEIAVVIGTDLLRERERWFGWPELRELVTWIEVPRAGHGAHSGIAIPDVSSTEIRARLAEGRAIGDLVPAAVAEYVDAHRLYRAQAVGA